MALPLNIFAKMTNFISEKKKKKKRKNKNLKL